MDLLQWAQRLPTQFLQHWSYPLLFLFALLESIPFFGLFVPGQSLIMTAGFFAKLGVIGFWEVVLFAALGAFLGDIISFLLGRKYGSDLLKKHGKWILVGPDEYRAIRTLLQDHPRKAIIIGRFNSVTRAFTPFLAGTMEVKRWLFLPFTFLTAFAWAFSCAAIGFLFGHGYQLAARYIGTFAFAAIVVSALFAFAYKRVQRFLLRHKHVIVKYPVRLWLLTSASLLLLAMTIDDVKNAGLFTRADIPLAEAIPAWRTAELTAILKAISFVFDPTTVIIASFLIFAALLWSRRVRTAAVFSFAMLLAFIGENVLKLLFARERPLGALVVEQDLWSFPSGHTTMATVLCGFLLWAYKDDIADAAAKWTFMGVMVAMPLLAGASRIYLGAHWFSDVLAGWAAGVFSLNVVLLLFWLGEYFRVTRRILQSIGLGRSRRIDVDVERRLREKNTRRKHEKKT